MSNEHADIPPICDRDNYNALRDHGLSSAAQYLVKKGTTYYQVINGATGEIDSEDVALHTAINALMDDNVTFYFMKPSTYFSLTAKIDVDDKDNVYFRGGGWGTEVRAADTMNEMFDLTSSRFTHFEGLLLNGYNKATVNINGSHTHGYVPMHHITDMFIWGAKEANVDLSGCEDCVLTNTYLDGRIVESPVSCITQYGLRMTSNYTGGQINLYGVYAGYHTKADYWFDEVDETYIFGGLSASKSGNSGASLLEAGIKFEGGANVEGQLELRGFWMENNDVPNIKVVGETSALLINGGRYYTNDVENISGSNNPSIHSLSLWDTKLDADGTVTYNVDAYILDFLLSQCELVGPGVVNTSKITDYYMNNRESYIETDKKLYQNEEIIIANDTYLCWKDSGGTKRSILVLRASDDAVLIQNLSGNLYVGPDMTDDVLIGYNTSGAVSIGTGDTKPSTLQLDSDGIIQLMKAPKFDINHADATLGGTAKIIECQDVNGDTYYFKVYPTKT